MKEEGKGKEEEGKALNEVDTSLYGLIPRLSEK